MASENKVTLSGKPADPDYADPNADSSPAPQPIDPKTGMHEDYWVLSAEERAKGFIRPVRTAYIHVGIRPTYPTRPLTSKEQETNHFNYVAFEEYPESASPLLGRYWTEAQLKSGCQQTTTMHRALAETYARDPKFYGATFCATCHKHFPVGAQGEFIWADGSNEKVGT